LPGVLLVGEGSGCLGSVFLSLDTVRSWGHCISSRRALVREDNCGRSFLIPCGRFPINDQSKYAVTGTNGLPWSFGAEGCRPTFWMFRFAWRGAISTGRRRGNKWVYIAAGVDGWK